ncbi:MAG: protein kinase [Gammaproteobacteria bacterium]|nr:protein kinase [Gammaproteobacteria bacterium]
MTKPKFHPSLLAKAGAWRMLGETLETGWIVVDAFGWDPNDPTAPDHYNATGGNFSVAYKIENDGRKAFLKAVDFSKAMGAADVLGELQKITSAHAFERDILDYCTAKKLDHVVVAIESGQHTLGKRLEDNVPYLIFELAEGDVRRRINKVEADIRLAWWLRAMHHTAVGLTQLHQNGVSHQDLKPSNVLAFRNSNEFKIADLGRSVRQDVSAPHEGLMFPGDYTYAPPEVLYSAVANGWKERRLGSDIYMLGSMIFFYTFGVGVSKMLIEKIDTSLRPTRFGGGWIGKYADILPDLQYAFTQLLDELSQNLPEAISADIVRAASELCTPDLTLRGDPLEKGKDRNQFVLARYVSLFDRLAKEAEIKPKKIN